MRKQDLILPGHERAINPGNEESFVVTDGLAGQTGSLDGIDSRAGSAGSIPAHPLTRSMLNAQVGRVTTRLVEGNQGPQAPIQVHSPMDAWWPRARLALTAILVETRQR